jgi:hypothetical protein
MASPVPAVSFPRPEKSSGIAAVLTIFWPGAGHLYLGMTQRGIPHVIANTIGFLCAMTLILFPVAIVIWLFSLCLTVGSITRDTEIVNQAIREGRRVTG